MTPISNSLAAVDIATTLHPSRIFRAIGDQIALCPSLTGRTFDPLAMAFAAEGLV
jgi:hypothetical protein